MSSKDNRNVSSSETAEVTDPRHIGWGPGRLIVVLLVIVGVIVLILNSDRIRRWWEHRQQRAAYVDVMTLEAGDIEVRDLGGYFSDGKLYLQIAMDHKLPNYGVSGVNDDQFDVEWEVSVVVDGEKVHATDWTGSPNPVFLFGSSDTPRFETIQAYVDNGATVTVNIRQNGRDILIAGKPLVEKQRSELDLPRTSGKAAMLTFHHPAEDSLRKGQEYLEANKIDEAIHELNSAISDCPLYAAAYAARGRAFLRKRELDRAKSDFVQAVRLSKASFDACSKLALVLTDGDVDTLVQPILDEATLLKFYNYVAYEYATCPTDAHRDGDKALAFAKRACDATNHQNPEYLKTLAAAHAECGEFAKAIKVAQGAIDRLGAGVSREKSDLQKMVKDFKSNRRFRRRGGPIEPTGKKVSSANQLNVGDRVEVEWGGLFWPATVLEVLASGSVKVHYTGWSDDWDEEVEVSRLRLPTKAKSQKPSSGE